MPAYKGKNFNNIFSLYGGGEMGHLTRSKDWSLTSVGSFNEWPQTLRITLSILLNSKFPMLLYWGPQLVCFYNDAYRACLGQNGKHPSIFGMPAKEAWPEIWDTIEPLFEEVLHGGDASWAEDQLIPIYRNGKMEDVYWTFSYSPVNAENGEIAGVWVTSVETTKAVLSNKHLDESKAQLHFAVEAAELGTWDYNPATNKFTCNDRIKEWFGLPPESEIDLAIAINVIAEKDRQLVVDAIQKALDYSSGGNYDVEYSIINPLSKTEIIVQAKGKAWFNDEKIAYRFNGTLNDVTAEVQARREKEESEKRFQAAVSAVQGIVWTNNPLGEMEGMQPGWAALTGQNYDEYQGYGWANAVHPEDAQPTVEAWNESVKEKKDFIFEHRVKLKHGQYGFFAVRAIPLLNKDGSIREWVGVHTDITIQKNAEAAILESDRRFRNTVQQAPIGITILRGENFIVEMANDAYLSLVDRSESSFTGKPLFESLPEVESSIKQLLNDVLSTGKPYHGSEYPVPINRYGKEQSGYFDFLYHPLREENGSISGIIITVNDVTEKVESRKAIEESEQRLRSFVENAPFPIGIYFGNSMRIQFVNQAILDVWGKGKNVLGKTFAEVLPELEGQGIFEQLDEVFTSGVSYHASSQRVDLLFDGELKPYYFNYSFTPLFDIEGKIYGVMNTAADVTGLVSAKKKIEDNEQKLNVVIAASELGTWELNLKTNEFNYSEKFLEIFGIEKGRSIKHNEVVTYFLAEDLVIRKNALKAAYETGLLQYSARIMWSDKSIHWIENRGKVFYGENNTPLKIIGTTRNITTEKNYQQTLEEREQKFRLLADSMPQFVWTGDPMGNLNYFNQSVYNYSGLSELEVEEKGWLEIVHPDDREENIKTWLHAVNTGTNFIFEHRFKRADGQYRWQLSRAIPQKDKEGNISMWVGTSTDIQEIKELDEQKDLFIGIASHELKTPITTIKGYVQLLQSIYGDGTDMLLKDSLATIDRQIINLTTLIADLLDLSKIKSGSLHLAKEDFDINEMVEEIITNTRQVNPGHNIVFSKIEKAIVYGDKDRLGQVLINFLTNAIKYSPDSKTVIVKISADSQDTVVSVHDSGIGISKADQQKIFERFYRVEGKNEKTFPGFGIGLFIAAEIIRNHSGNIGVTSEQGKGSIFYFSLPVSN